DAIVGGQRQQRLPGGVVVGRVARIHGELQAAHEDVGVSVDPRRLRRPRRRGRGDCQRTRREAAAPDHGAPVAAGRLSLKVNTATNEIAAAAMTMKAGLRSMSVRCTSQAAASGASPPSTPKVTLKPSAIAVQRMAGGVDSTISAGCTPIAAPTATTKPIWPRTISAGL